MFHSSANTNSITLSQNASRFWIPFDVKCLENLTPKEYLEKYCRINHRRYTLYKRIFDKYKDVDAELNLEVLADALFDVYMGTISHRLVAQMFVLLDLPSNTKLTFNQFSGIAAFSERYFFNKFAQPQKNDSPLRKDIVEILDFSSLKWKISGVNVSPKLEEIFKCL